MAVAGSLRIDQGGFAGGTGTYSYNATTGTLVFNNTSGSYGVNNDPYWPTTNGPQNVNVQGAGGITMNVARTVGLLFQYAAGVSSAGNLTLNGTSRVNTGGFTSGSPTYGASSLLIYNTGGVYGRNGEWLPNATGGAGYPVNVQLSNNTNLDLPNGSSGVLFQMAGNLTIDSGSNMNLNGSPAMTQPLNVLGNVVINGTLTLSSALGGDLKTQGNFTNNGTFTHNNRAVFFEGGAAQLVNASSGSLTMPYVRINKSGGTVQLGNTDLTTLGPAGGDSILFQTATSTLTLNTRTLTLGSTVGTPPAGSGLIGDASATLSLQDGGTGPGGPMGTFSFVSGGQTLVTLTINRTAANGSATLGSDLTVGGTLNLTSGDINTGLNTITMPSAATSTGIGDVVGNVRRTGFVNGLHATNNKSFGNPNVQLSFQTGTPPGDVLVNLAKSVPTGAIGFPTAVQRTYTVSPDGGSGYTATLRLHYLDAELNGNTEALLDLWRFNGTTWSRVLKTGADTVTVNNKWIESNAVTQLSPWTLSSTPLAPTAARLREFGATSYSNGTLLEWRTSREVDNLGFRLWREDSGRRTLVTPSLIAGSALTAGPNTVLTAGNSYTWVDRAGGPSSRYWLEEIDADGTHTMHGPIYAVANAKSRVPAHHRSLLLSQLGEASGGAQRQWTPAASNSVGVGDALSANVATRTANDTRQLQLASGEAVKLSVRRAGWYRVTRQQLEAAGLSSSVDPTRLQLYADGEQLPLSVNADEWEQSGVVEFYGEGLDTTSTDTRVYWLVEGTEGAATTRRVDALAATLSASDGSATKPPADWAGKSAPVVRGRPAPPLPQSFTYTTELRERSIYFSSLLNGETENFFGRVVSATPGTQSINVSHLQGGNNPAALEVALQGVTAGAHSVRVVLNGVELGVVEFAGREHRVETFEFKTGRLREGGNEVQLVSSAAGDVSLTDYVRVTYPHLYRADADALRFSAPGGRKVRVAGFSTPDIRVVDVTDPTNAFELQRVDVQEAEAWEGGGYAVVLMTPGTSERTLLAFTEAGVSAPAAVASNGPSSWSRVDNEADFVIITHRNFRDAVAPLAAKRAAEGLSTRVVDVEDLYDEFSYGAHTPLAVRDFLTTAHATWQRAPRYVLLVGDGSYDPRDRLGRGSFDLVPSKLLDAARMETASDEWLADFDGDALGELAVGRLPVRTIAEAQRAISKIVNHEPGNAEPRVLLVSDRRSVDGFDFESVSASLQTLVPEGFETGRIDRGARDAEEVRNEIIDGVNAGPSVVNWLGHGSVDVWTGDGLLRGSDAATLTNGARLPLFVMMTCLNGYYADPSLDSLGEALLKSETGGALAVWASTGLTTPEAQAEMNRELYRALFADGHARLGDAVRQAKTATPDRDTRLTWVLIGDPTSRVR